MIRVSFLKNEENILDGFELKGHAGFAESGNDIICAAVSALVFNTINSVEQFTSLDFVIEQDEKKGHIYFRLKEKPDHDTQLLISSLMLGLDEIQKTYGKKYIRIEK